MQHFTCDLCGKRMRAMTIAVTLSESKCMPPTIPMKSPTTISIKTTWTP